MNGSPGVIAYVFLSSLAASHICSRGTMPCTPSIGIVTPVICKALDSTFNLLPLRPHAIRITQSRKSSRVSKSEAILHASRKLSEIHFSLSPQVYRNPLQGRVSLTG